MEGFRGKSENMKIKYRKLYNQHMRRNHPFLYFIIYILKITAYCTFVLFILSLCSLIEFKEESDALGCFLFSTIYISLFQFIIPFVWGFLFADKLRFPGIGKYLSKKLIVEHIEKEKFFQVIAIDKDFFESENWFVFDGIYIPKNLVVYIHVNRIGGSGRIKRVYYDILLSTGAVIKKLYVELSANSSKYRKEFITEYITNYYVNRGYKGDLCNIYKVDGIYERYANSYHANLKEFTNICEENIGRMEINEEDLWGMIEEKC